MAGRRSRSGYGLGLARSETILRPYDVRWEEAYRTTEARLREIVGSLAIAIEHVGSTAVPGLVAKPILDIALAFPDRATLDEAATQLSLAGYEWRGDVREAGGVVFVEGPESVRTAHLHLVERDDPQWDRYVRFRDLLRTDREIRVEYEGVKVGLAARLPHDRAAYTDGKDEFIREALKPPEGWAVDCPGVRL
jgi:GrpB-like predicted nucleotidyltransferase (UPF0157 family)